MAAKRSGRMGLTSRNTKTKRGAKEQLGRRGPKKRVKANVGGMTKRMAAKAGK